MIDFNITLIQNKPQRDVKKSLQDIENLIEKSVKSNNDLFMLPESSYHPYELPAVRHLAQEFDYALDFFIKIAKKYKIYLCTGSIFVPEDSGIYNRAYLINPEGEIILTHDKCHLYDINFQGLRIRESRFVNSGKGLKNIDTPLGKIGMLICYDIRFPESMRSLGDCDIVLIPAAFNQVSGPAHWDLLFRTRAVENQCYVAACSPARDDDAVYVAYGHSMLVDPWGSVIVEAGQEAQVITTQILHKRLNEVRGKLPLSKHRRPEIYSI